jgi:hypothetical protein
MPGGLLPEFRGRHSLRRQTVPRGMASRPLVHQRVGSRVNVDAVLYQRLQKAKTTHIRTIPRSVDVEIWVEEIRESWR